jgi:hypothetical protein
MVPLSTATLPHMLPFAFIFADHVEVSASAGLGLGVYSRRGGGGGGFDMVIIDKRDPSILLPTDT